MQTDANTPDTWTVVRLRSNNAKMYRLLCSWYGGYLGADTWRLSSQINTVEKFNGYYCVHTQSGSTYYLYTDRKGMSNISAQKFEGWQHLCHKQGYVLQEVDINEVSV
jgi:hypothetical protein